MPIWKKGGYLMSQAPVPMTENELTTAIIQMLKEGKVYEFQQMIDEFQPFDLARLYTLLPEKHHYKYLLHLSIDQITDMIQELDQEQQLDIIHKLGT